MSLSKLPTSKKIVVADIKKIQGQILSNFETSQWITKVEEKMWKLVDIYTNSLSTENIKDDLSGYNLLALEQWKKTCADFSQ